MTNTFVHEFAAMGTAVSVRIVGVEAGEGRDAAGRAARWFTDIEACCNRFDPASELRVLCAQHAGTSVPASAMLFEAVRYALAIAEETDGAFDPTIGVRLEALGFDRDYRSGARVGSGLAAAGASTPTWRDVRLDESARAIILDRPLLLDLGAVAKGLAVDLAARELAAYPDFAIDAGGDLYLAGRNERGESWTVGVRHPRAPGDLIDIVRVSDAAVCTSGDYERRAPAGAHHIIDPATGAPADAVASVTVVAPAALPADALGTAAFALGAARGLAFLERSGVEALIVTPALERFATVGFPTIAHVRDVAITAAR
ncbi:MAG TPA: FAD:protein FMN transferase [Gemmatimonadaceae bacterium]|nr:FAD:protein FMN transferase [Gemmatimonadaceae bacterium]